MGKNIDNLSGGALTDPTSGILYIAKGGVDYSITYEYLVSLIQAVVSANTLNIATNTTNIATLQSLISKQVDIDKSSDYTAFSLGDDELILGAVIDWVSNTPDVKFGTSSGSSDISLTTYSLTSTNPRQNILLFKSLAEVENIYVGITSGHVNITWILIKELFNT